MKICYHPDAATVRRSAPASVRYERTTASPVRGMIRRVATPSYDFLERVCPDCRARVVVIIHDPAMNVRMELGPSLLWSAADWGADPMLEVHP